MLATQNPIESEGVYALPEAQRDRFLMQILVDQPSYVEELEIARRMGVKAPEAVQMLTLEQLVELQKAVDEIFVHHAVQDYAVRLVMATRDPVGWRVPEIAAHVGSRCEPARHARPAVGRTRARACCAAGASCPQDVADVAPEILRHRLILTYDALADGVTTDDVITQRAHHHADATGHAPSGERPAGHRMTAHARRGSARRVSRRSRARRPSFGGSSCS